MFIDFQASAATLAQNILALRQEWMGLSDADRVCIDGQWHRREAGNFIDVMKIREAKFIADWSALLVLLRDSHGWVLDVAAAIRLLNRQLLTELCDPDSLVGKTLEAVRMRAHLVPYDNALNQRAAHELHPYDLASLGVYISFQSLRRIPHHPPRLRPTGWRDDHDGMP